MDSPLGEVAEVRAVLGLCWKVVLIVSAVVLAPSAASGDEKTPMGTLSGKVTTPDGKPVVRARVSTGIRDANTRQAKILVESLTDAGGRFRLGPIEPFYRHRFDLVVEADGFARLSTKRGALTVYPGRDFDLGTLKLDRGRIFTGQVLDVDGKPRPNAVINPMVARNKFGHTVTDIGQIRTLTTDSDGRFRTQPSPVGHLRLTVRYPERQLAYVLRLVGPDGEEDLGTIRLEKDVPFSGAVRDEEGKPIADVAIGGPVGFNATTDTDGRFTLRGCGPNPKFQLNVTKRGYAPLVGRVTVTDAGISYVTRAQERARNLPAKDLVVTLRRAGLIEGQAVDAETGEPVRLTNVVVCNFERKPNGEVALRGCRSDFEQTEPGRFRATFPVPDEYHLTFSAAGYLDAEAFTPKVTELTTISGIVARMRKKAEGLSSEIAKRTISGTVMRNGKPVKSGWVGLWSIPKLNNAVNAWVMRGRTVVGAPLTYESAPIQDGSYRLDVPFQRDAWYVVAEEPDHALTQIGPVAIGLNEHKTLDITCVEGGVIRGRVRGVPSGWEGHVWVVAFSKTAVQAEAQAEATGAFLLPPLPPGEYGLKVGHDAYEDAETYPGALALQHREAFQQTADPWKRAKVVKVQARRDTEGVEVEFPR